MVTGPAGGETPAERYDRLALPFVREYTPLLLAGLAVPVGGRVLDHGAGTGEVTLELHRRFPDAAVTAVDPDAGLLGQLRAKAGPDSGWLRVRIGTLDTVRVGAAVDVVLSQLVLSLTTDPAHELRALHTLTGPGGVLRAAVLGGPDRMRAFAGYWAAAHQVVPDAAPPATYPHLRFSDPEGLQRLAVEAGWVGVHVDPADTRRQASATEIWRWLSLTLPIYTVDRRPLALDDLGSALVEQLRAATLSQLHQYETSPGWYDVPTGGWLLTGAASR